MIWTDEQIKAIREVADKNNGHCDRCGRVIKIYSYKVNAVHARTLRSIADYTKATGERAVNLNKLDDDIAYSAATQRTKLRLHGLIAKYKEDGVHKASHWVITKKGWSFLAGESIQEKVIVFDNQVLGHSLETTTINRLTGDDVVYEDISITPAEAEVLHDVRTPKRQTVYQAIYKGNSSGFDGNTVYTVRMDKLQIARPIHITTPFEYEYQDIAAFQREWQILREIKEDKV